MTLKKIRCETWLVIANRNVTVQERGYDMIGWVKMIDMSREFCQYVDS